MCVYIYAHFVNNKAYAIQTNHLINVQNFTVAKQIFLTICALGNIIPLYYYYNSIMVLDICSDNIQTICSGFINLILLHICISNNVRSSASSNAKSMVFVLQFARFFSLMFVPYCIFFTITITFIRLYCIRSSALMLYAAGQVNFTDFKGQIKKNMSLLYYM